MKLIRFLLACLMMVGMQAVASEHIDADAINVFHPEGTAVAYNDALDQLKNMSSSPLPEESEKELQDAIAKSNAESTSRGSVSSDVETATGVITFNNPGPQMLQGLKDEVNDKVSRGDKAGLDELWRNHGHNSEYEAIINAGLAKLAPEKTVLASIKEQDAEFELWFERNKNDMSALKTVGLNGYAYVSPAYLKEIERQISVLEKAQESESEQVPALTNSPAKQTVTPSEQSVRKKEVQKELPATFGNPPSQPRKSNWLKWAGVTTMVAAVAAIAGYVWWIKMSSKTAVK